MIASAWADESQELRAISVARSIWQAGPGEGFKPGSMELSLSGGAGIGMAVFGTKEHHDWWIGNMDFGYILTDVLGRGKWYAGNVEVIGEVFGGEQFHPTHAYFVGGGPHVRYNFATGTRWVPFVEIGGGLTATEIRDGDLSTTMEFNLQAGLGARFFLNDNTSLLMEYKLIHFSNAGIQYPNLGVNNSTVLFGLSWMF